MSLLETLVALSLGLLVLGVVLSHFLAAGQSSRLQAAQAHMTDDAQIALQLLASELSMAGFAWPQSLERASDGRLRWTTALAQPPVLACDHGFVSPSTTGALQCAAQGSSAALAVRYQADADNTVPLSGTSVPSDCLGAGLRAEAGVYWTENRWFVASSQGRSELRCASRLGHPGQPLVENVESLALWFSQAQASDPVQPVRYVTASQVGDWARVRSVRLCLLMRSAEPVLSASMDASFRDCQGQLQTSGDARLRRAFQATVALRAWGS